MSQPPLTPPPPPPPGLMDGTSRVLWLAKHHFPEPGFTLIHESEARIMQYNAALARRDLGAFKQICEKTLTALGAHGRNYGNLWEAAGAALFHHRAEERAADRARDMLRILQGRAADMLLLAGQKGDADFEAIARDTLDDIEKTLQFMQLQRDARPDRRKAPAVAAGIILDMTGKPAQDQGGKPPT